MLRLLLFLLLVLPASAIPTPETLLRIPTWLPPEEGMALLSPDGTRLLTYPSRYEGVFALTLRDVATGELIKELQSDLYQAQAQRLGLSHFGVLAAWQEDGSIITELWNCGVQTGGHETVRIASGRLIEQPGTPLSSLYVFDNERQDVGDANGVSFYYGSTISKWQPGRPPQQVARVEGAFVEGAAVSADERWLAAGCGNERVYLWDAARGRKRGELAVRGRPERLAFSSSGRHLVVEHRAFLVPTLQRLRDIEGRFFSGAGWDVEVAGGVFLLDSVRLRRVRRLPSRTSGKFNYDEADLLGRVGPWLVWRDRDNRSVALTRLSP